MQGSRGRRQGRASWATGKLRFARKRAWIVTEAPSRFPGDLRASQSFPPGLSFPPCKTEVKPCLPISGLLQGPTQSGCLAGRQGREAPQEPAVLHSDPKGPFLHPSPTVCAQQLPPTRETKHAQSGPSDSAGVGDLAAAAEPD